MMRSLTRLLVALVAALLLTSTGAFSPTPIFKAPGASTSALSGKVKVEVIVGDGEPIESALRRFKREVNKSGHLMQLRHKRYFENAQEKKKRKVKEASMRKKYERMQRKRMQRQT